MHRFSRGDVGDLRPDVIPPLHVAVHFQVTGIAEEVARARGCGCAFRAVKNRALLFAEVAGLFEGNHGLVDENFCGWFFIGNFHGLLGEGLGLAPPRVEGTLAEHPALGVFGLPLGLPSVSCRVPTTTRSFWLLSIAAGGAGLPRGTAAAGAAGADFQWVRVRVFSDAEMRRLVTKRRWRSRRSRINNMP